MKRFFLLLLTAASVPAASWYVDNTSQGANNGTSWANAWGPTNIVWASVNPGDTVFVSGGSTTKVYSGGITVGKNGTASSRITIRIGQDEGHNGVADFGTNGIGLGTVPFGITVDGYRGLTAYPPPTNWAQVKEGSWTNNIGFWTHDKVGSTTASTDPAFQFWTEGTGEITYRYYHISGFTNTFTGGGSGLDERGVIFYGSFDPPVAVTNIVFEYLLFRNNSGSQFTWEGATNDFFDGVTARFLRLDNCGEDHFKVHGGWTIRDSVLGPLNTPNDAHCDFFQITGGYFRLFNCYIMESQHSYIRFQSRAGNDVANPRHNGHIRVYNNIFSEVPGRGAMGGTYNEGIVFVNWDSAPANGGYVCWTNILVANNTFYGSEINLYQDPDEMARNPFVSWTKGTYVTNAFIKNVIWQNNLHVQKHKGYSFPLGGGAPLYEDFTTNDFVLTYNVFAGTNSALHSDVRRVGYLNQTTNLESHALKFNNTTNFPQFTNTADGNFELLLTDTAALNQGVNLSAYFTTDSLNRPRNGMWDIGALELQAGNDLLVHLDFEDDFTLSSYIQDKSGSGNHAWRYGYTNSVAGSNFPNRVAASLTPGTNGSTYAGDFNWYADGHGIYGRSGDYGAITNGSLFTNMTYATIAVRGRHRPAYSGDYSEDANAQFLSAGSAVNTRLGSWDFGRWNQQIFLNNTRFIIATNSNQSTPQVGSETDMFFGKAGRLVAQFPDRGFDNGGNTTNWHHYAITWNAGVLKLYFDGRCIGTNDSSGVITNLNVGAGWIGVGCNTHVGTNPYLNDGESPAYPNNGFLNGMLDDVRIYNRALADAEVQQLASGTNAPSAPDGGTPVSGNGRRKVKIVRN